MNNVLNFNSFLKESLGAKEVYNPKEINKISTNSVSFSEDEDPEMVKGDSLSAPLCSYYDDEIESKGSDTPLNFWKNEYSKYTSEEIREFKDDMLKTIDSDVSKLKSEYVKWFNLPSTRKKISEENRWVVDELIEHIKSVKCVVNFKPPKEASDMIINSWGYAPYPKPNPTGRFYINLYNFWNGKKIGDVHVSTTMRHEVAHIIDYFLRHNGVDAYIPTHNPEDYQKIYLINDKDQFTRMNVFRRSIGAGPVDSAEVLLNKFMEKVNSGIITSDIFDFSSDIRNDGVYLRLIPANDLEGAGTRSNPNEKDLNKRLRSAKQVYKLMAERGGIILNGKEEYNIEQLFSNMAIINKSHLLIDFESLSGLNKTMVKIDPNLVGKNNNKNFA